MVDFVKGNPSPKTKKLPKVGVMKIGEEGERKQISDEERRKRTKQKKLKKKQRKKK